MKTPRQFRQLVRQGLHRGPTAGQCEGYVQANLMILPQHYASAFQTFCSLNAKACPLLAVGEPGSWALPSLGSDIDVRVDIPAYSVYKEGKLTETRTDLTDIWQDDLVVFALGCSFSFEFLLHSNKIPVRHVELNGSAPVYITDIPNTSFGPFAGNLAVSMRPLKPSDAIKAIKITSQYPQVHGAPIHFGRPGDIGIKDLDAPDFYGVTDVRAGEVPVFWACGLTPQVAVMTANLPIAIGHAPGHMLVTDMLLTDLLSREDLLAAQQGPK